MAKNEKFQAETPYLLDVVQDRIDNQSVLGRFANFFTVLFITIIGAALAALSYGFELPEWAVLAIVVITQVASVVGVRLTPNGISPSVERKLAEAQEAWLSAQRRDHGGAVNVADYGESPYVGRHRINDDTTTTAVEDEPTKNDTSKVESSPLTPFGASGSADRIHRDGERVYSTPDTISKD